jgi:hypothetical protein
MRGKHGSLIVARKAAGTLATGRGSMRPGNTATSTSRPRSALLPFRSGRTAVTSPTGMPRKSTGAPTDSPRTDSVKRS